MSVTNDRAKKEARAGLLFALPWFIGFSVFLGYPLIKALYNSFTDFSILNPPVFIGTKNYVDLVQDKLFYQSLGNTLYVAFFSVPLSTVVALGLAMLLNTKVKGQAFYRTFFFLPALVPAVPLAILWLWLFNGEQGIINTMMIEPVGTFLNSTLGTHLPTNINFLGDKAYAKSVLVLMSMWTTGHAMVIYLAGLQEVPKPLYEAADIDGASAWQRTRMVTLPLLSPVIMFNVIMAIIGSLQYFTQAYVMFPGGAPEQSTYLYTMYIFDSAFRDLRMGYASAMGWVMFLIILLLTNAALKFFDSKVHYEGG